MKKIVGTALAAAALSMVACEPARRPVEPGASPVSGPIALTKNDAKIVIAAEDHDEVVVLDRSSREVLVRIAVGDAPSHLVVDGDRAVVTSRYGHTVSVVDIEKGTVLSTIAVGTEPMGLTLLSGDRAAVALAGDDAVAILDLAAGTVVKTIALADEDPRAVALLKDGTLYVTHMATGKFSRVNIEEGTATLVDVNTRNDFGVRLVAEHLRSITLDPKTGNVLVAHSQANQDTVRAPIGDENIQDPSDQGCGYGPCPTQLGAVVPGVTEVDPGANVVQIPTPDQQQNNGNVRGEDFSDCFDCEPGFGGRGAAAPPSVLNSADGRFGGLQLANPTALALFDGGRGQLVVNMGSKNALLLRRELGGTAADVVGVVKLGNGAEGVALSHDGTSAFVWNRFDASISEIELPDVDGADRDTRFVADGEGAATIAELGVVPEFAADTYNVLADALDVDASIGRKMFHDATDSRISVSGSVSCASCHPDGRTDKRTWQFTFGPRNTPQLGGNILDTAPFHWPGDVPTVADLNGMTVLPFMGGTGLDPGSFEFIASFIGTIREAPSRAKAQGLNDAELRGKAIFESAETGCTACHAGDHGTDNLAYDIGSKADQRDITTFQTPVLRGLHRSAPYFHDGRYRSVEELLAGQVATDKMGVGSHLSTDELKDLAAYLKTF